MEKDHPTSDTMEKDHPTTDTMEKDTESNKPLKDSAPPGCLSRASRKLVMAMEHTFYWYGHSVASYPILYIVMCFVVTGACCLGFFNFYMETRPEKLWIPQGSDYVLATEWQAENFPNDQRIEMALFEAENVLTPTAIREMYRITKQVERLTVVDEFGRTRNQSHLCFQVPVLKLDGLPGKALQRRSEQQEGTSSSLLSKDWSLLLGRNMYCNMMDIIPKACLQLGIVDIWEDDETLINSLTQQDIINGINTATLSARYLYPIDFSLYLGGVSLNSSGHIVGAVAALHQWVMAVNRTAVDLSAVSGMSGLDSEVDVALFEWEGAFIKEVLNTTDRPDGVGVYISTERSFGEISGDTILGDVTFLIAGNVILFIYVTIMLGRFDIVEQRPLLSMMGLLATLMAVGISFGLCSAFKLAYGPVHSILPLLMLGLGVDDMFVIVQCWNNLPKQERSGGVLVEQVGRALQHAGVAITVTSLTDMLAFAIGSSTVLPALRSFCIYSAVGIVALYVLQATFFVAWFALDQRRMTKQRNGLLWCYTHEDHTPRPCSQRDLCQTFFDKLYAKALLSKWGKAVALLATAVLLAVASWGVTTLRQEFNPVWFLPQSSYLFSFLSKSMEHFPDAGTRGQVYLGQLDYPAELPKIATMTNSLLADPDIASVDSWYLELANYTYKDINVDIRGKALNKTFFSDILGKFIFSPSGSRFQSYFKFDGNISCVQSAPRILASKFDFQHGGMQERNEQIEAMDRAKEIVSRQKFSDFAAPVAVLYSSWETDKVITEELIRNLLLAMVAVLAMTLLLIANLFTSIYVFICVLLTLVDVMALMAWWGLTIDTVSCINLVLCIGLCVDYSAHIGLHFMQVDGSRDERVHKTLVEMAPAVLNGAFSTFLAFVLLANSDSHVFQSFFKIFFGVFVFGVFHGLVFLPVLLSLIGPASYATIDHLSAVSHQHSRPPILLPQEELSQGGSPLEGSGQAGGVAQLPEKWGPSSLDVTWKKEDKASGAEPESAK